MISRRWGWLQLPKNMPKREMSYDGAHYLSRVASWTDVGRRDELTSRGLMNWRRGWGELTSRWLITNVAGSDELTWRGLMDWRRVAWWSDVAWPHELTSRGLMNWRRVAGRTDVAKPDEPTPSPGPESDDFWMENYILYFWDSRLCGKKTCCRAHIDTLTIIWHKLGHGGAWHVCQHSASTQPRPSIPILSPCRNKYLAKR